MKIRTVTGDIDPAKLGRTLVHEHLLYTYPGSEYDHRCAFDLSEVTERVSAELGEAGREYGFGSIVDLTPCEVGRHPQLMHDVALRSGVNVIGTTGFFPQHLGMPYWWRVQTPAEFAEFFIRDVTEGMVYASTRTTIKAGILKVATGMDSVDPRPSPIGPSGRRVGEFEERAIRGAGQAQKILGCCINTHTDPEDYTVCNPGIDQIELLESEGADPTKVIIGHAFVKGSLDQLKAICDTGATVQLDHMGIPWRSGSIEELDQRLAELLCEMASAGYLDRLTITYDRWFYNPRNPGTELNPELLNEKVQMGYLYTHFLPRLKKMGFREEDLEVMLVQNPARLLAF